MQTKGHSVLHDELAQLEQRHQWTATQCDGHEWDYLDTGGDGVPVLLLPGSVGDSAVFVKTLLSLGTQRRLIAITYPALADAHALAHGLAQLMDTLDLERAVVVGSSFAAYWIQFFALHYPERVAKLVLGNGFIEGSDLADNPLFDRETLEKIDAETLHAEWRERLIPLSHQPLQGYLLKLLSERQSPKNLHARLLGVARAEPCPPLSLTDDRIVVIDCPDDPLIPAVAQKKLRQRYPGAQHVSFENGGHYPHLLSPKPYERFILECSK
ncbi:alpha/beta hydrolase [Paenalcaligenes niemegkensis]|uniref:alpha/beta fold hydrolase n=1 Tax=Paenalcaligenes niemegkensis TaxID=2895469 RepID=UPI001EE83982|nr:alpha/beta hydrolase [Paenalcaligenes niemegkensis]MCQ9617911.1 alpha/beta hydrolase [Paenalcaligenes niemegkensis]